MHEKFSTQIINMKIFNKYICATATRRVLNTSMLYHNCNIYPSINTSYISADLIARNFSCTDVNNNLQLKTAELL